MKKVKICYSKKKCNTLYQTAQICDEMPNFFLLSLIGAVIGFINGFWGGGGGMVCVPTLSNIVGLKEKQAHATAIFVMLPLSVVSFVVYAISNTFEWSKSIYVGVGFIVGSVVGALLLKKIKNNVLNIIFSILILASGIKLIIG